MIDILKFQNPGNDDIHVLYPTSYSALLKHIYTMLI